MRGNSPSNWKTFSSISSYMEKIKDLDIFGILVASYSGNIKGFNENKVFEHGTIHMENLDFESRYEKLLSELLRYPWKK